MNIFRWINQFETFHFFQFLSPRLAKISLITFLYVDNDTIGKIHKGVLKVYFSFKKMYYINTSIHFSLITRFVPNYVLEYIDKHHEKIIYVSKETAIKALELAPNMPNFTDCLNCLNALSTLAPPDIWSADPLPRVCFLFYPFFLVTINLFMKLKLKNII